MRTREKVTNMIAVVVIASAERTKEVLALEDLNTKEEWRDIHAKVVNALKEGPKEVLTIVMQSMKTKEGGKDTPKDALVLNALHEGMKDTSEVGRFFPKTVKSIKSSVIKNDY